MDNTTIQINGKHLDVFIEKAIVLLDEVANLHFDSKGNWMESSELRNELNTVIQKYFIG